MKAEPSQLIRRKLTANLGLLIVFDWNMRVLNRPHKSWGSENETQHFICEQKRSKCNFIDMSTA